MKTKRQRKKTGGGLVVLRDANGNITGHSSYVAPERYRFNTDTKKWATYDFDKKEWVEQP